MPSVYTHYLVARETYKLLPPDLQESLRPHLSLYFFGAQGADFCFFYRFANPRKRNLGSYLHRKGGYDAFRLLQHFSRRDTALFAYALGFITHYAVDTVFHPFVYAVSGKSLLLHSRVEGALDALYVKKYTDVKTDSFAPFFRKKLTEEETNALFLYYATVAEHASFPTIVKPSFLRAISMFNAYMPLSFSIFGERKPQLIHALFGKDGTDKKASALFQNTVEKSRSLIGAFCTAKDAHEPLPKALFGKSYLTGE